MLHRSHNSNACIPMSTHLSSTLRKDTNIHLIHGQAGQIYQIRTLEKLDLEKTKLLLSQKSIVTMVLV